MNSLRIAFAVVSLLSATPVSAHGALRPAESACLLKIGPDFIYFSGYQPAASRRKFCEDIPTTGDTIFALDFGPPEMREMKAELRILRDAGDDRSLASTVAFLPPKVYPNGTLNFEHGFREAGDYLGVVTVDGPHGEHWVAEFPFFRWEALLSQSALFSHRHRHGAGGPAVRDKSGRSAENTEKQLI